MKAEAGSRMPFELPYGETRMRNLIIILGIAPVLMGVSLAHTVKAITSMPDSLKNARSVYLTSPSGDEFGMFPMPGDKEALIATRKVIRDAHRLKLVFDPDRADLIVMVSGGTPRDTIKVFDTRNRKKCLWYLSAKNGLHGQDALLAKAFESEFEKTDARQDVEADKQGRFGWILSIPKCRLHLSEHDRRKLRR
jgi:hypothetical protein